MTEFVSAAVCVGKADNGMGHRSLRLRSPGGVRDYLLSAVILLGLELAKKTQDMQLSENTCISLLSHLMSDMLYMDGKQHPCIAFRIKSNELYEQCIVFRTLVFFRKKKRLFYFFN